MQLDTLEEKVPNDGNDYGKRSPKLKTPDDTLSSDVSNDRYISLRSAAQTINSVLYLTEQHQRATTSTYHTVAPSVNVHSHSHSNESMYDHRIIADKQQQPV